ncbi:MAG: acetylornithine/N-succinyldiaminopimelate aminotransferase [Actinomycetota bacterium]|nr:acetylornithine/N-succinyldiaminopimelate aminotransferase [Actinomycetota bacterium]
MTAPPAPPRLPAAAGEETTAVAQPQALSSARWLERHATSLMGTYGTPQRVLVRGEGCYVWDAEGRRYLDLLAGIAVNALGHAHPLQVAAVTAQMATLGHVSNFFATPPQVALAERILDLLRAPAGSRVFLCNSGTEAVEGAVKLARRTGRPRTVCAENAFHGRSMGALSLTAKAAYREPFEPLPGQVTRVPFGDVDALRSAVDTDVAAVFLEPIQGEGGVVPAPAGYLAAARAITREAGALLVLDEVQTGTGRTGHWFAHQDPALGQGIVPDVVTLAKGLGGGFPIGALVALGEGPSGLLGPGQHGSTFGGNPVAAAASLATLHVIERDGLLESVRKVGAHLTEGVLSCGHPLVAEVRGAGLLLGIGLRRPVAAAVCAALLEDGFIANAVAPDTLRLVPPLLLTVEQADTFLGALPRALDLIEREIP